MDKEQLTNYNKNLIYKLRIFQDFHNKLKFAVLFLIKGFVITWYFAKKNFYYITYQNLKH